MNNKTLRSRALLWACLILAAIVQVSCAVYNAFQPTNEYVALVHVNGQTFRSDSAVVPFTPPAEYRTYWRQIAQCSGRTPVDSIRLYVVRAPSFSAAGRSGIAAGYDPYRHAILIAEPYVSDAARVRHEMLHAVLEQSAETHPDLYFKQRCASLVTPS